MQLLEGSRSRWSGTTARPDLHVMETTKVGGVARQRLVSRCWRLEHTLVGVAVARGRSSAAQRNYLAPRPARRDDEKDRRRCQSSAMTRGDRESRMTHRVDDGDRRRMPVSGFSAGAGPSSKRTLAGVALLEGGRSPLCKTTARPDRHVEMTVMVGNACHAAAFGRSWHLEQAHAGRRCCCTRVVVRGEAERTRAPISSSRGR